MKNTLLLFFSLLITLTSFGQVSIDPYLTNALSQNPLNLQVIVSFHGEAAPTTSNVSLLEQIGITQGITFRSLPIAGVIATPGQIEALSQDPSVRSIYLNRPVSWENNRATVLTGVDKVRTDATFTFNNGGLPVSGDGIGLVVNDSGIDGTHPDLQYGSHLVQNATGATNLNAISGILPVTPLENIPNTDATGGHGTHVAGIAGGTGAASSGKYEGVAPGADLVGYGSGLALLLLDVASGFDYALTHQFEYGIRVITNSWGTTSDIGTPFDPNDPINISTKKCTDRNIVVVFSAGNSGSASGTITGNYKKAPWVICVAAGDKQGRLGDFSSRGVEGNGGTVVVNGQTFVWEDRPTVTAPGVSIISTRAPSPTGALGTPDDLETIEDPAHLPYYTTLDGTSMAAPHVAGIVALLLDANPQLTPYDVKAILQQTATNMPGYADWEVGAGYVNAYAAVDLAYRAEAGYGGMLKIGREFVSEVNTATVSTNYTIDYSPLNINGNEVTFNVAEGTTAIEAQTRALGLLGTTGNLLNLALYSPSGLRYSAGIPVTFTLSVSRGVAVSNPEAGTWTLAIEDLNGIALPETVDVALRQSVISSISGLNDVVGHPAESSIRLAISSRLMDGKGNRFRPNDKLNRIELADYLSIGQGVRQYLATDGSFSFSDVSGSQQLLAESVMATGAALRDGDHSGASLLVSAGGSGQFKPSATVTRAELAYTIIQSLGLQAYAESLAGEPLTADANGESAEITDASTIPAALQGHVQAALNLNLINAFFYIEQGPFDLFPTVLAEFKGDAKVTRAEFAVIITRTFEQWQAAANPLLEQSQLPVTETLNTSISVYPNPTANRVNIQLGADDLPGAGQLELFNQAGHRLQSRPLDLESNRQFDLDLSDYPAGMYILRISQSGKALLNEKLIRL
ncbi:S8 family serine peptidase [Flavilitoribacter nigricans]|uniref:Peptidase S8 n=1 Tax=Flavilitoribacter nigricans (strain ATCC 23147 / DSM 23189 / NBRC 102662 / NCIMB 1420 / SS-2) TaxID=1122177 RepID=A0A2D0N2R1_FLAN2|nr:S8 family serine peptidase [Flavilitoribacter nigricans]PHN02811.1 peptidase S8 [Flavilitoribacter nigricans DSM 23189 = NBRC 102662]